jgi:hypothetical protein
MASGIEHLERNSSFARQFARGEGDGANGSLKLNPSVRGERLQTTGLFLVRRRREHGRERRGVGERNDPARMQRADHVADGLCDRQACPTESVTSLRHREPKRAIRRETVEHLGRELGCVHTATLRLLQETAHGDALKTGE